MSQHPTSELLQVAINAALAGGAMLRRGYGTHFEIESKPGKHNLVTEYDRAVEQATIRFIQSYFPTHSFLGEEGGARTGEKGEVLWIIDPLDGTVNFAHGIPIFCISIAAQKNDELLCGVIYQPITHELFVAEKGKGAFLNGSKIHVTAVDRVSNSIIATGFPYNISENPFHFIEHFDELLHMGVPLRRCGSAAIDLAYVAAGRYDAHFEAYLQPWDLAAGALLIQEAGGQYSEWNLSPFDIHSCRPFLATNGKIHRELSSLLSRNV